MRRPRLEFRTSQETSPTKIRCPHCDVVQQLTGLHTDWSGLEVNAFQCLDCGDYIIDARLFEGTGFGSSTNVALFPKEAGRQPTRFRHCDPEVEKSYHESCKLVGTSDGAAGAYARRTVELILEKLGYGQQWLAQKIDAAAAETDVDKRLPRRLIDKLNYLKETGNFGVHIRRNTATAEIVDVEPLEVEACIDAVEELVQYCFEQPAEDALRTAAMNEKLVAAGKKPIG